jgi:hypothetical protein
LAGSAFNPLEARQLSACPAGAVLIGLADDGGASAMLWSTRRVSGDEGTGTVGPVLPSAGPFPIPPCARAAVLPAAAAASAESRIKRCMAFS